MLSSAAGTKPSPNALQKAIGANTANPNEPITTEIYADEAATFRVEREQRGRTTMIALGFLSLS